MRHASHAGSTGAPTSTGLLATGTGYWSDLLSIELQELLERAGLGGAVLGACHIASTLPGTGSY